MQEKELPDPLPPAWEDEHPRHRQAESDDPMMMCAEPAQGDPWVMLDAIVEEYARIGWSAPEIGRLFDSPFYQATAGLKTLLGGDAVRARIENTLARCGVLRAKVVVTPGGSEHV